MAKEYIDKEAFCLMLYNRRMRLLDEDKEPVLAGTLHAVEKMAHDFPAADVRENVRGRWRVEVNYRTGIETVSCPNCQISDTFPIGFYTKVLFAHYCPNCGTKMDGEDGDNNE